MRLYINLPNTYWATGVKNDASTPTPTGRFSSTPSPSATQMITRLSSARICPPTSMFRLGTATPRSAAASHASCSSAVIMNNFRAAMVGGSNKGNNYRNFPGSPITKKQKSAVETRSRGKKQKSAVEKRSRGASSDN